MLVFHTRKPVPFKISSQVKLLSLCSSTLNSRYCSCVEYVVVTIRFVVIFYLLENNVLYPFHCI